MSKTYYSTVSFTDNQRGGSAWAKRRANKRVRKYKGMLSGSQYKRLFCNYDIHDYRFNYYEDFQIKEELNDKIECSGWKNHLRKKKSLYRKRIYSRESINRYLS